MDTLINEYSKTESKCLKTEQTLISIRSALAAGSFADAIFHPGQPISHSRPSTQPAAVPQNDTAHTARTHRRVPQNAPCPCPCFPLWLKLSQIQLIASGVTSTRNNSFFSSSLLLSFSPSLLLLLLLFLIWLLLLICSAF